TYPGGGLVVDGVAEDAFVAGDEVEQIDRGRVPAGEPDRHERALRGETALQVGECRSADRVERDRRAGAAAERGHPRPDRVAVAADDGARAVVALDQRQRGGSEPTGADRARQLVDARCFRPNLPEPMTTSANPPLGC